MKLFQRLFGRTPAQVAKARPAARCKPQLEGLEARTLLAGNVTATVSGGDLVVNGDGHDNSVSVWQDTNSGNWIVSGNFSSGALTTVNGQTVFINGRAMSFAVFSGVSDDVRIDLNGGADRLEMYGNYGNAVVPDDLEIDTDNGNDSVILHHLGVGNDINLETGSDKDTVWLEHVNTSASVSWARTAATMTWTSMSAPPTTASRCGTSRWMTTCASTARSFSRGTSASRSVAITARPGATPG
jgi:hypothetical protein